MKHVINDTDDQLDEEICKMWSGRVLSSETAIPTGLRCTNLEASPNPIILVFVWRLSHRHGGSLTQSPASVPFWKNGGGYLLGKVIKKT